MTDLGAELLRIGDQSRDRFQAQKRVLSFREYLDLFVEHPWRHSRDASRYLRDCFDYFGKYEIERPWGTVTRFRIFDLSFEKDAAANEERSDHLVGQEAVQEAVYRALLNFVREGRPNRLVLLHGPNGSAKTTFFACIMRALQAYSGQDDGALYRFSWIFPRGSDGKGIGFGSSEAARAFETYAHLPEDKIDVKLQSALREHPLLLIPVQERARLVRDAYAAKGVEEDPPDWVINGELSQKNRQIFEALLTAYRGDLTRVLSHVQVERYYCSRRYRVGAVTIGPQMAVDASERQITADRTLNALPASLSALTLYEPYGELVDATGGLVEFSDLLKRPLDAWKYLLLAIENGEISLPLSNLAINAVLMASSNELHLAAFREHPEYPSFRGRIQMVRVPYLIDYRQEQAIYDSQIIPQVRRHVAPHSTYIAAMWAVLTRLRRPQSERYANPVLGRLAADLTPIEKAELFAIGTIPKRFSAEESKVIAGGVDAIYHETDSTEEYEGLTGISPREVRTLLLDAAQDPEYECLAPPAVLERIAIFSRRGDYDFLKLNPDRGYHNHGEFMRIVRERWLDFVDDEVRSSTGLIDEAQYVQLFERYVTHVSYWVKKERVYNSHTGKYQDPDQDLMGSTEQKIAPGADAENFRRDLISKIAAHAIDNPNAERLDKFSLFPEYIERLKEAYFTEHRKEIVAIVQNVLALITPDYSPDEDQRESAQSTLSALKSKFGYEDSSVRVALGELLRSRYVA